MSTRGTYLPIGTLLAACLWATAAMGQSELPRIGWLTVRGGNDAALAAFRDSLRELGHTEGRSLLLLARNADWDLSRLAAMAEELVRAEVRVIVAPNPPSVDAARRATATIPIVGRFSNDPVASGLVASLARPGGNLTGFYSLAEELSAKRLEFLHQAAPSVRRVAVLMMPDWPRTEHWYRETAAAADRLGVALHPAAVRTPADLDAAIAAAAAAGADALITLRNPIVAGNIRHIVQLADRHRLAAIYDAREFVEAGGLLSYGANLNDIYRRAAGHADKIIKGTPPGELPIEQSTVLELVVNRRAAATLGIELPADVLARADDVLE